MTIYDYPSAGCEHPDFRQDKPMGWSKMKLLLEAARAISSELDLKAILHKAIDIGMEAVGGSEGAIFLLDDKGQMTECLFSLRGKPILKEDVPLVLEKGLEAWVKKHKKPALLADVLEDERWLKIPKKVSPRVRSALCVPAIYAGRLMAIMTITHPETGQFSEIDLDVLLTIASQVAVAIENSRLFEQAQREIAERLQAEERLKRGLEQLASLNRVSQAMTASLELEQVLAEIVSLAREVVDLDYASIMLVDKEGKLDRSTRRLAGVPYIDGRARDNGFTDWVVHSRQAIVVDDVNEDGTVKPRPTEEGAPCIANPPLVKAGVRSFVGLPLEAKGRLLGVLFLHSLRPGNFRDQLPLLTTFASYAAVAIENARLYSSVVEERHKAETILQSLADGVYVVDRQGHITLFNSAAEKITGRKAEEALGRHCSEIFVVEDEEGKNLCQPDTCPINLAMSQRRTWLFDQIRFLVTPDGRRIPVSVVTAPLFDEKGEIFGAVDAFWDISGRYEVERLKDEFISLVSHELRSPLTSIKAAAQLNLRRSTPYDENTQREMWQIIAEQCDHLIGFVETILSITRLEAGRVNIEVQPLLVEDLLEKAVTWQKKSLRGRAFFEIISPPSLRVLADEAKTLTILNNLLDNAVKFSPKGGRVFLEAQERADSVLISVQDEGPGIPSYALERIFDKFYQVNGTDSRMHGYGMGLYIVKMLAEAQGGQVWAENRGGTGSRLCFTLPKVPGEWDADKR